MKQVLLAVLALLMCTGELGAQLLQEREKDERTLIQAGMIWGLPQGGLADNLFREPLGGNLLVAGRVPGLPLWLGSDVSFLNHGLEERLDLYEIEEVPVQAITSSVSHNILMFHLLARMQIEAGPVQPWLDLLGGFKLFSTRNTLRGDVVVFPEGLNASSHVTDRALSYGLGAGIRLPLYRGNFGVEHRPGTASLTVSARYLFGTDAEIVTESEFDEADRVFRFGREITPTELLIPQFGIQVDL